MTPEVIATLFWKSSNPELAVVDEHGVISVVDVTQIEGEDDIAYIYAFTTTENDGVQDESWHRTTVNVK